MSIEQKDANRWLVSLKPGQAIECAAGARIEAITDSQIVIVSSTEPLGVDLGGHRTPADQIVSVVSDSDGGDVQEELPGDVADEGGPGVEP